MNKHFHILVKYVVVPLVEYYRKRTTELVRIEATSHILQCLDSTRKGLKALLLIILLMAAMGMGLGLIIIGIALMIFSQFMDFRWALIVALCLSGLICFLPFYLIMFCYVLSDRKWMQWIKRNKFIGNFVEETLSISQKRLKR
jgi:energy-coupling factor transporter transmembrane protein EcfT